ncbi:MAG: pyridoxine 5'-phosphate synthase [Candidatus Omnitrophica bacterium]|nr:pyridoxine 5'-phosphate synthase [Candidatus Omnitrophota bacterium]MDD5671492.1 pyridoxine 5'-phosphate synthase [Candidatus Omnitrophota bacterium]
MKLGVNIDHIATVRQARGGVEPSPFLAALQAQAGGADGITVHLREDRRHIQDHDVTDVQKVIRITLNLEMSLNPGIVKIALKVSPEKVCLVPEKRRELTTEGGLDVCANEKLLKRLMPEFHRRKIEVSLFIDPSKKQIRAAGRVHADTIEIHTGAYANASGARQRREWMRIKRAAKLATQLGLQVNAGHGLNYENVDKIAAIPEIRELNIGHAIVSRALFVGLKTAVREMKQAMRGR